MAQITRRGEQSLLNVKSKQFAVEIVSMIKQQNDWRLNSLYQQVLRSATSVHANIRESEFAQSPADFISKLSIARKEANETLGWLEILRDSDSISEQWSNRLYPICNELGALLTASIKTIKRNNNLESLL